MAIKDTNKNLSITVSKELWNKLNQIAQKECRSVSKQSYLFLIRGLEEFEKKRD